MFHQKKASALGVLIAILGTVISVAPALAQGGDRDRDRDRGHEDVPSPPQPPPKVKILPPDYPPTSGQWRLGVTVDLADVGAIVRDVAPRSAAARVGLERSDVIVAVNGYQVGRVLNRTYALEDELQRRAGPRGEVRLLVQDRRSSRLVNLDVQLDRWAPARDVVIRGNVTYRERMSLPPGAELRLELERRTPRSREVVSRMITPIYGNSPFPFEFRYPIEQVQLDGDYGLTAEIWSRGTRIYTSRSRYPVVPGPSQSGVELQLRRD